MKRIILSISLMFGLLLSGFSQNDLDALRYSQSFLGGTARSVSMGGAFGALGSDFASLSINPAGLGMFRSKEFTITPTFHHDMTTSTFLGTQMDDRKNNFNMSNLGLVMSFPLRGSSGWKYINLGIGYNELDNFHQDIVMEGVNHNSSLADFFVDRASGFYYDELNSFGPGLAWNTWLISESDSTGLNYGSVLNDYGNSDYTFGLNQRRVIQTTGTKGEYMLSLGTNYNDKLFIGATIGISRINFYQEVSHIEEDLNETVPDLDNFYYYANLKTQGTGFNFKLGVTYRPVEFLRIGTAIHLPTYYKMEDDYYSYLEAEYDSPRPLDTLGYTIYSSESPNGYYEYELNTPFKFIGSVALQIKKFAIISVDYEYINYSSARLKDGSDGYDFTPENEDINTYFQPVSNIRIGSEFKLGLFSLRGGYAYYGKPYISGEMNENSNYSFITGGIGLRTKVLFLDLAYQHGLHEEQYLMYGMQELEETTLNTHHNKFMITVGYRF